MTCRGTVVPVVGPLSVMMGSRSWGRLELEEEEDGFVNNGGQL